MPETPDDKMVFTRKSSKQKTVPDKKIDAQYRERAANEAKRFADATTDSYWFCLCFSDEEKLNAFREALKLPPDRFIGARTFECAVLPYRPEKRQKTFAAKIPEVSAPDPFDGIGDMEDFEQDSFLTVDTLLKALTDSDKGFTGSSIYSGIWICVVFSTQKRRDAFIADYNLGSRAVFDNKYINADGWIDISK